MKRAQRFRVQITRIGYLFILLSLGVGIAGLNTGNNLLYLIFSMMLSFIVLSGILSNNTLQHLLFVPEFPHRIFANSQVPVRLSLKNEKRWFPSFSLSLSTEAASKTESSQAYILKIAPEGEEKTVDFIRFPKRGKISLPDYRVETSYPFGLIRKFSNLPTEGETVIYPELIPVEKIWSFSQKWLGDFLSGQRGGESNPYGVRDFLSGESARNIHWKTSARLGELKSKEFEQEKRFRIRLELWLEERKKSEPLLLEKAISLTASLLLELIHQGFEVSLSIDGEAIRPQGRGYIDSFLSALALISPPLKYPSFKSEDSYTDQVVWISDSVSLKPMKEIAFQFGPKELGSL